MKKLLLSLIGLLAVSAVQAQDTQTVTFNFKPSTITGLPNTATKAPTTPTDYTFQDSKITLYKTFWAKSKENGSIAFKKGETDSYISFATPAGYAVSEVTLTNGTYASSSFKVLVGETEIKTVTFSSANTQELTVTIPAEQQVADAPLKVQTNKSSNQCTCSIFKITYTKTGSTNPDLDDAGLQFEETNFTVALGTTFTAPKLTNPNNLTVTYDSSDKNVADVDAETGAVTIKGVGTTIITATSEATDTYKKGVASYTLNVEKIYGSIAELLAGATEGEKVKIGFDMTVGYVNGQNCFVADSKGGYMLVFGSNNYEAYNIIPDGWIGTYTIYNGLPEVKTATTMPASTENGVYVIETVPAAEVFNQPLNKIVKIEGVTLAEASPADRTNFQGNIGDITFDIRNEFNLASVPAGDYNMTVAIGTFVSKSSEITEPNQLKVIEFVKRPSVPVISVKDGEVITDGVLDLEKGTKTIVITVAEGEELWYMVTETTEENVEPQAVEFTKAEGNTQELTLSKNGSVEYYSVLNGVKSAIQTLTVQGANTTAIAEVGAEANVAAEWFDMQGRRVAAPAKGGVYILKQGSKTSKRALN